MPKLLFSYSLYHARSQEYELLLTKIKKEFSVNTPDIFLNNPEYLVLSLKEKEWQKEIINLIERLKICVNAEIECLRSAGSNIHIVYRFGILEMESKLFQYPPDLEDDD